MDLSSWSAAVVVCIFLIRQGLLYRSWPPMPGVASPRIRPGLWCSKQPKIWTSQVSQLRFGIAWELLGMKTPCSAFFPEMMQPRGPRASSSGPCCTRKLFCPLETWRQKLCCVAKHKFSNGQLARYGIIDFFNLDSFVSSYYCYSGLVTYRDW